MSSSVFFKFKSQKEPSRVTFDGTGISVFELKRSIITINRLGDGTDFDLAIYNEDTNEEYDDDAAVIPRSTSVVARRLPPAKPGRGSAVRYVSGKMPVNALNSSRTEKPVSKAAVPGKPTTPTTGASDMAKAQSEEEKIAAMFKAGAEQWDRQQQEMANATPVYRQQGNRTKPNATVPNHPPPSGYICYRCGEKGHWIQECPTNNDPNFDGRPRVKRTTGIPRSFLRTIEKPAMLSADGMTDTGHQPSGVMVNADGDFVVAEPDQASWEQYQAKTKVAAVARQEAESNEKELEDRGIKCALDNKLYVDPVKTPCCKRTYCNDCITNSLIENDLICPGCESEGILLDDLVPDEEMAKKVKEYLEEKEKKNDELAKPKDEKSNNKEDTAQSRDEKLDTKGASSGAAEQAKSPSAQVNGVSSSVHPALKQQTQSPQTSSTSQPVQPVNAQAAANGSSKKRPAEDELSNDRTAPAPKMQASKSQSSIGSQSSSGRVVRPLSRQSVNQSQQMSNPLATSGPPGYSGPAFYGGGPPMAYSGPNMNNYMGMQMTMGPVMPMNPAMIGFPYMNGMNGYGGMMNGYGNQGGGGNFMPQQQFGQYDNGFNGMGMPNGGYGNYGPNMPMMGNGGMGMGMGRGMGMNANMPMNNNINGMGRGYGPGGGMKFQQGNTVFNEPPPDEEDSAYFRRPVNNHRHQSRQRRARPSDYREL